MEGGRLKRLFKDGGLIDPSEDQLYLMALFTRSNASRKKAEATALRNQWNEAPWPDPTVEQQRLIAFGDQLLANSRKNTAKISEARALRTLWNADPWSDPTEEEEELIASRQSRRLSTAETIRPARGGD